MKEGIILHTAQETLESTFNKIYRRNKDRVSKIAEDYATDDYCDIEDIEQEIWTRVWEKLPTFEMRSPEEADAWLFQVANNAAFNYSRTFKNRHEEWDDDRMINRCYPYHPLSNADPDSEQLKDIMYEAIDTLSEHEQNVIYAYLGGLTHQHIADKFNLTIDQVDWCIRTIKKKLRQLTS